MIPIHAIRHKDYVLKWVKTLSLVLIIACEEPPPDYLDETDPLLRDAVVEVDPLNTQDAALTTDMVSRDMESQVLRDISMIDQETIERMDQDPPLPSCLSTCDCTEGQSCLEGRCQVAAQPSYCCERDQCPSGTFCEQVDGSRALCPSSGCISACDCPTGQACVDNRCELSEELGLTYCCQDPACPSGRSCELPTGEQSICEGEVECAVTCDCQAIPGTMCRAGQCIFPPIEEPLIVCCETDCITGLSCETASGSQQLCP